MAGMNPKMKPRILYEDAHILVVYKPAGLATQAAGVGQPDLVSELKKELTSRKTPGGTGQAPYLALIHRLDQPVEGLLVFGKDKKAAAQLTKELGSGTLNKQYFAVVCGKPAEEKGILVDFLAKDRDNRAFITAEGQQDAKKAELKYRIREEISTPEPLSLADIHIETGRFHQIRCQMANAGMPLLGDLKYGTTDTAELSRRLGIRCVALCAYKLQLRHPVTLQRLSFEIKPENPAFDLFSGNQFGCDCLY